MKAPELVTRTVTGYLSLANAAAPGLAEAATSPLGGVGQLPPRRPIAPWGPSEAGVIAIDLVAVTGPPSGNATTDRLRYAHRRLGGANSVGR